SINAFSVNMGGTTVSYNAVSNAITGLVVGDTYQIYCHDVGGTGGTKTWLAYLGTSTGLLTLGDDVVLAGQVTIPSSGTSGGGGTGTCVSVNAWVIRKSGDRHEFIRAGDVGRGDWLRVVDPITGGERWGRVTYSEAKESPCVRASTDTGTTLTCSVTAPLGTLDGRVLAPESFGAWLAERVKGFFRHRRGKPPVHVGVQLVQHITCEDTFFLAGDEQHALLAHHNLKP
ncbi:MAG: hypothetical protein KGH75_13660, partial [Rhodospirillales bacterium]|nr:hypothetical protein [Rhodospirillales bacterium]